MTDIGVRHNTSSERLIDFMARFATSEQFNKVFQEGMSLVEETANYLDGPGRQDARALDRHGSIAYATESMRLTTRLMQLASWLLLQRAVSAGELTEDDAVKEKTRINLEEIGPGTTLTSEDQLPDSLKDLVERSLTLHQRVMRLDQMINDRSELTGDSDNPVGDQVGMIAQIFGGAGQNEANQS